MDELFMGSEQFFLRKLQVANWGTFSGIHTVELSERGHLFVGGSGSGKSTLLDAISVLLTPGRINFNAAARQGERRSDRSFMSYIRGAWSSEQDTEGTAEPSAQLLHAVSRCGDENCRQQLAVQPDICDSKDKEKLSEITHQAVRHVSGMAAHPVSPQYIEGNICCHGQRKPPPAVLPLRLPEGQGEGAEDCYKFEHTGSQKTKNLSHGLPLLS